MLGQPVKVKGPQKKAELKDRSKCSGKKKLCLRGEDSGLVNEKSHSEVVSFWAAWWRHVLLSYLPQLMKRDIYAPSGSL
ncbi:hypothetical protein RvY_14873 [Ramazzottius varieornatus]|uniref:Uncharacterized protein n=1 Tax=Ramazzottius varieornatus TaxID=947166 RepID=A0A1D1VUB6_RAMVA|nr:hypothetical protein RvY_14873 [Ramazzottius varieornatus]